ncbi:hypothetical protein VNO80_24100 [Phaseolus coccineus]|uniref:SHSP domain-containing protein n=1 Tax=Phaseolus coccineus TaxID=3886 RepID=A0AAN9LRX9_PHACN
MASSLAVKRFLSSSLLSKSLLRPAASASRSFNTIAIHCYHDHNVDFESRSESSFPRTARREDIFSDVLVPFFPTRSLSQVLIMMDQFMDNPFLSAPRGIGAGDGDVDGVRRGLYVRETEDALLLRLDMPGLGKEDVKISVEHNTLTIKGEGAKEDDEEESAPRYTRIDFPNKFYKVDHIKAEMKNGVLKVVLPKKEEEEETKDVINVNVE